MTTLSSEEALQARLSKVYPLAVAIEAAARDLQDKLRDYIEGLEPLESADPFYAADEVVRALKEYHVACLRPL